MSNSLRKTLLAGAIAKALAADQIDLGGPIEVWFRPKGADEATLVEVTPNIVPKAMRSYILKASYAGGAQISNWYIAPFINAADPSDELTAANFNATLGEFTNYVEGTRPAWVQEAESGQAIANSVTLAKITAGPDGGIINGIVLTSVATKGNAGGTLAAATRFGAPRPMVEGDELLFRYTMQANLPAA